MVLHGVGEARAHLISSLSRDICDSRVVSCVAQVPRDNFVPEELHSLAYEDCPLSIGYGQTISQPFIVALMSQELALTGIEKVLEIGTGSAYQTAILALLAGKVVTVERIPQLLELARKNLDKLGYKNIEMHLACDELGFISGAPYDAILVTAGAPDIPDILLRQLSFGGRMVIPTGPIYNQKLLKVTKGKNGIYTQTLCSCRFVPLIGRNAWPGENGR